MKTVAYIILSVFFIISGSLVTFAQCPAKDSREILLAAKIVDISHFRDTYVDGSSEQSLVFHCEYGNQKDKKEILVTVSPSHDLKLNKGDIMKLRLDDTAPYIAYLEYKGKSIPVVILNKNSLGN